MKSLRPQKLKATSFVLNLTLCISVIVFSIERAHAQNYPPDSNLTNVSYNPPNSLPGYLQPFSDENFGNQVTRISSLANMGGDNNALRHEYVTNQPWNADGTKIQLYNSGASYILDGETYEILDGPVDLERYWSHVDPNKTYYFYDNRFYTTDITTGVQVLEYDFSPHGYTTVKMGNGSGYLSYDDELVGLNGYKASNGNYYAILFNTFTKTVMAEMLVGPVDLETIKISPSKQYIVTGGVDGSNNIQGTNVYDLNFNHIRHLYDESPHSDVGYDINGNE
ncbi:MAG: hypothetical protein KJO77_02610, partial [Bacteroidia bacterium]|nr:hypothetical protein [Bacteroidia bacterium]